LIVEDDDDDESYTYLSREDSDEDLSFDLVTAEEEESEPVEVTTTVEVESDPEQEQEAPEKNKSSSKPPSNMPFSPKAKSRKSDIDPSLVDKMKSCNMSDDKIIVDLVHLVSVYTRDGRETVAVDILAPSGTESHAVSCTVADDGRSIEVNFEINSYFTESEWISSLNQRFTNDSSRVGEFIKVAARLKNGTAMKKMVQQIKLPIEVERVLLCENLLCLPNNDETNTLQVYSVQFKSVSSISATQNLDVKVLRRGGATTGTGASPMNVSYGATNGKLKTSPG